MQTLTVEGLGDPTGQTFRCGYSHMYWFSTRCTFYLFKNLKTGKSGEQVLNGNGLSYGV